MNVTRTIGTDEAIAYLTEHGFTSIHDTWFRHHSGYARVIVEDPDAMCFTVKALEHPSAGGLLWQVRLTRVPMTVFAATVTAAIS
jgi:hypothetical protein